MNIGIDIMGGDYAPDHTLAGVYEAAKEFGHDCKFILFGDQEQILKSAENQQLDLSGFEIVHCPTTIEMNDHPAKAFQEKKDSSIVTGFKYLATSQIDGFASAGNTGAMLVGSMTLIKAIPGIERPAITSPLPRPGGRDGLLLDVGIYPDAKPENLYQYGVLGSVYAKTVNHLSDPTVGLLNIGSEPGKGSLLAKSAFNLMEKATQFNFAGNLEGSDLFRDESPDVVICDGFTGNIVLKQAEFFYRIYKKRNLQDDFFERFNFESYGGAPVLGINKPVIIGHGVSKTAAIKNMLLHTKEVIKADYSQRIKEFLSHE
ncbi:MAG: phosphate--acyl-ACP acyltransferase [Salinivirgaceae bacterium]|nr:MAG: phosphate--acyl-ACP acyltransferase [Salinivirgaceae bacterium]